MRNSLRSVGLAQKSRNSTSWIVKKQWLRIDSGGSPKWRINSKISKLPDGIMYLVSTIRCSFHIYVRYLTFKRSLKMSLSHKIEDRRHTLSFLSQRNLSLCAFLCMNTPSRCPESTDRISMALLPQPMIWPVPMNATDVGASPHWSMMFFDTRPYVET